MSDLHLKKCVPCEGGVAKLDEQSVLILLAKIPGWQLVEQGGAISRSYSFENYWQTMAFVNAVAFVAHTEDHHPDLSVHYNRLVVRYNTHAVGGLTDNDFICAAKINQLLATE